VYLRVSNFVMMNCVILRYIIGAFAFPILHSGIMCF